MAITNKNQKRISIKKELYNSLKNPQNLLQDSEYRIGASMASLSLTGQLMSPEDLNSFLDSCSPCTCKTEEDHNAKWEQYKELLPSRSLTLKEIKTKIGYEGNDKIFRMFVNLFFSGFEPEPKKKCGRPKEEQNRGRREKLYFFPSRFFPILIFITVVLIQKLLPFKVHELLKIFGETINDYIKTLPVNEQQQYYEAIAKENVKIEEWLKTLPKKDLKRLEKMLESPISDLIVF